MLREKSFSNGTCVAVVQCLLMMFNFIFNEFLLTHFNEMQFLVISCSVFCGVFKRHTRLEKDQILPNFRWKSCIICMFS